jgi:hypothetical protein
MADGGYEHGSTQLLERDSALDVLAMARRLGLEQPAEGEVKVPGPPA